MAIQWMEGFDHYNTGSTGSANMAAGPWANTAGGVVGVPNWGARTGNYSYSPSSLTSRRIVPTPTDDLFVSFGYSVGELPSSRYVIFTFKDASNADILYLTCENTGTINLRNAVGTTIASTSGPVIVGRNWHFLEVFYNGSTNAFSLRVDDADASQTPVIEATSVTGMVDVYSLEIGPAPVSQTDTWFDDILVHDTSGGINDGWLGDRRIATLFANADTAASGWTPSYFKRFGTGIGRLSYYQTGFHSLINTQAYISAAASTQLDIGANDFTLETEVNFDAIPTGTAYSTIFNRWDASQNRRSYRLVLGGDAFNNSCLQFDTSTDGTSGTVSTPIVYPWVPETNRWYNICLCRTAGELLLFVDGVQLGLPIADSSTYFGGGAERLFIGAEQTGGGGNLVTGSILSGYLDETRFTNGVGRYASTYTPATEAFPRGISDPDWAQVVLLMGYEDSVTDESSYARTITSANSATFITPSDGPDVGVYSTVNKEAPADGSYISASYAYAHNVLTMITLPADGDTVTVGTTDGSTPAVYRFKNTMSAAFDVQIEADAQTTLENLLNAINAGAGSGTAYFAGTTSNFDVLAELLPDGQIDVVAIDSGTGGNSIASTATGTAAVWDSATLTGGASLPGPTTFKLQRPPRNTTVITGMQLVVRALKTDAGLATIQSTFIGGLGGEAAGASRNLTTSASYYQDIIEEDPDTSGPITPTTIINGSFEVNRTV